MNSFLLFVFHVYHYYAAISVYCSLVITCWERTDLLALLCLMFPCVFVTFPYGVTGQLWYLIVSNPDLCFLLYFICITLYRHFHKYVIMCDVINANNLLSLKMIIINQKFVFVMKMTFISSCKAK